MSEIEALAIAGRFAEARAAFNRARKGHNSDWRLAFAGDCEEAGDRIAISHPKAARWFYNLALDEFRPFASSAQSGYDSYERGAVVGAVEQKLAALPK